MKITINNFRNILDMDVEIQEKKLNFIYGISGSGKTSLAKALTTEKEELDKDRTFGSTDAVTVDIESNISFKTFNDYAIDQYIITKSGSGIYDVLYGENPELVKIKNELSAFLSSQDLKDVKNVISNFNFKLKQLEEELNLKRGASISLSNTGWFKTLSNENDFFESDPSVNTEVKNWVKAGYSFISEESDICPFCDQEISDVIIERIKKIAHELPVEYEKVINANKLLKSLAIETDTTRINDVQVRKDLKDAIDNKYKVLKQLFQIDELLNISINDDKKLDKKFNVKLSAEVVELFNESDIAIEEIIKKLNMDKDGYSEKKNRYNKSLQYNIGKNIIQINNYFDFFGIKYKFVKSDKLSKITPYTLEHIKSDKDSSESLSTGEKNIIALVLFVLSNSTENIIVDDPASSFDEYRREQILSFIFDVRYKKSKNNMTTLILSHDQIFLKFLAKNYMKPLRFSEYIGEVLHFENINNASRVVKINYDDISSIGDHIKNKLSSELTYTQKIINLRLLYELHGANSIEYSYLSAILHSKIRGITEEQLHELLDRHKMKEQDVLKNIQEFAKVDLQPFKVDDLDISLNTLSNFEKICCVREYLSDGTTDKKELNSVIHFNYALNHILNPYKFNFQSEKCYQILSNHQNIS